MTHRINVVHTAKDNIIYTTFNTQSSLVHLSCPPECRQLSLQLTVEQSVRKSTGFSRVIFYMWVAADGCEMFLRMAIFSTFCKLRFQAPGTAMVLEGQDSKTGTEC